MTMWMSAQAQHGENVPASRAGDALWRWARLTLIELRRSPAILGAVAIALVTWWLMRDGLRVGVVRWSDISSVAGGNSMVLASAITAGMAAYVAGRDHRRRTMEQVAITSADRAGRDLAVALPVLLWCVAGYAITVAGYFAYAAMHATWGGPEWAYVQIPLVGTVASAAFGWLAGSVVRHRLVPLLVIGLVVGVHVSYPATQQFRMTEHMLPNGITNLSYGESWWRLLVPWEMLNFVRWPEVIALGTLWLVALAVVFWCLAWWRNHRCALAVAFGALATMVGGLAAAGLVTDDVRNRRFNPPAYVQPTCEARLDGQITVCLHPRDAALLDECADAIAGLMVPIAGIPGVPARFEAQSGERVGEGIVFNLYDRTTIENGHLQQNILREVVSPPSEQPMFGMDAPQYVVSTWLLGEAAVAQEEALERHLLMPVPFIYQTERAQELGITDPYEFDGQLGDESRGEVDALRAELDAALERFLAIPDGERRAWIEANWKALTSGELTLEDLP